MITARRVTSLVGPFLFVLALGAIAVAARGESTSGQPQVHTSSVPTRPRLVAESGPSCPLSLPEQVKSVKAFAEMMPVFRHPRCSNCHGGVNPFVEPELGNHRAGAMEPPDAGCQDCHDQLPGWTVPGTPMFFPGRSDEAICMQVKEFEPTGESFVEHIRHDHGNIQFIAAGFNGDRALDAQSLADHDVVVEKPPGTQAQLTEKARKWVKAMGGNWVGSPECGCAKPRVDLKMTSEWTIAGSGSKITEQVSVTVPLEPDSSGFVYKGTAPVEHGLYSVTGIIEPSCRVDMKPIGGELAVTEARFDVAADERMTISLAVAPTMGGGTMTFICPKIPLQVLPILPWSGEWQYLHQPDLIGDAYHFDEFESASGLSLDGGSKMVGRKEVTRSTTIEGVTATANTIFELWWVGVESR